VLKKRKKVFGLSSKRLILVLLLLAGTRISAAPTVDSDGSCIALGMSTSSGVCVWVASEISEITQYSNPQLEDIAVEFITPSIFVPSLQTKVPASIESLPPIPAAILMTLTGFICVSLVKDRRTWLTITAGLFFIGQTGIDAVPKLVRYVHEQQIRQSCSKVIACMFDFENSFHPRSNLEGTRYTGLLRRLAGIPNSENAILKQWGQGGTLSHIYKAASNIYMSAILVALISVIIQRFDDLSLTQNSLAPVAKQLIYLNPRHFFLENSIVVRLSWSESDFC